LIKKFEGIDILVNNAGILKFGKLENIEPSFWATLMRTNAYAPWVFMVAVVPEMRKIGGGSIINISSIKDVTDAAPFLASDQSPLITGVLLNADGGRHMATNRPPAA
jgi:3alpha(or 20beta)-hydroxysteroid dehydrogenase